jgi:hypothetical protein
MNFPKLSDVFPYEYKSCGYFRLKGIPKYKPAHILHGEESIIFVYNKIKEFLENQNEK